MSVRGIKLLVLDVDGVLTDGSIVLDEQGQETKRFHVRDGMGIKLAMANDLQIAIATARMSRATTHRAIELGIKHIEQGAADKRTALENLCQQCGVNMEDAAYLGDDLQDIPAIKAAGLGLAVADAAAEVQQMADHVTQARGGYGAVREAIEYILQADGRWDRAIEPYAG